MGLSGFPTNIDVILGSAWSGVNGLDPTDVLTLIHTGSGFEWSEDGTDTPNAATNRLKVAFSGNNNGTTRSLSASVFAASTGSSAWSTAAVAGGRFWTTTDSIYGFLDLWSAWTASPGSLSSFTVLPDPILPQKPTTLKSGSIFNPY